MEGLNPQSELEEAWLAKGHQAISSWVGTAKPIHLFIKLRPMFDLKLFTFFLVCFLSSIAFYSQAQDPSFSQYFASPLSLNPALTGTFDGRFRASSIYRDQWRSALEKPITTFSTGLDLRMPVRIRGRISKDAFSLGLLFLTDRMSAVDYTSTQINVSAAYHKALSLQHHRFLTLGFQFGIIQRSINYQDLFFSDQFNGINGYTDLSAEKLPPNNIAFPDFSWGFNYSAQNARGFASFLGFAMQHFTQPQINFFSTDPVETNNTVNRLPLRYVAHINFRLPLSPHIAFQPRAMASLQEPHFQADAGGTFRFLLSTTSGTALHLGASARAVRDHKNLVLLDGLIGLIGIEYSQVLLGFSYDINIGNLSQSTSFRHRNTFEISIAYLGNYQNDLILCPKF